ncbi:Chloride channel [Seminavis robusta]|uniref:Chloride channel n=1 Tax=Seminavis robusta TaxID=568900 RepID=A0A9N8E2S0_9STRA|nr:Chloride channel [Seminavis robusta]|eukprot:Sro596_g172790.1 Chloride channel (543) ;mRNA; r:21084-22712
MRVSHLQALFAYSCWCVAKVDGFSATPVYHHKISSLPIRSSSQQQQCPFVNLKQDSPETKHVSSTAVSASHDGINEVREDESRILPASIVVGTLTAAMGFLYGQVLSRTVHTVWKTVPATLAKRGTVLNPVYFITGTCTLGGLIMGILSAKLKANFTVADFVSAFSSVPAEAGKLPQSRSTLMPLLLLSLVTSTFGFSVGPEAPMVVAGALVGSSLSRKWFGMGETKKAENLAYAGAAGALTAFMGIPIAGSIFALELTRSSAGLSTGAKEALSPAVAASVAALVLIRAILIPNATVGGHFAYGTVGSITGRTMMMVAVGSSVIGAALGTVFHKAVALLKGICWPTSSSNEKGNNAWRRQVVVKTLIGLAVGLLSSAYPQTLFWGEGSLQCVVDGQKTAFAATKHGLPTLLTTAARVNPSLPFESSKAALQVGVAKLVAIALACAGKFPGGIIFPLFFAAAPFAHACSPLVAPSVLPLLVLCTMAATQASVTRTPLATALILSLSASASTELSVMLPACLVASYFGVYISQLLSRNSYFKYS